MTYTMNDNALRDWLGISARKKPQAVIADLDDTLCRSFDIPITEGVRVLAALSREVAVHYVTARTEVSRAGTEKFLLDLRLPGWNHLHFCPPWQSSRLHKREVIARLAGEYQVLLSIGDSEEEKEASLLAKVPFVEVDREKPELAWQEATRLLQKAGLLLGFGELLG